MGINIIDKQGVVETFPLAIIVSRFNEPITQALYAGALKKVREYNF